MNKNSYYLVGTLILLLALAYFVMQKPGEQSVSEGAHGNLVALDSLAVNKIEIRSPHLSVRLEKRGDDWFVASPVDYKADQSGVAALVHQIKNFTVSSVISSNPEKQSVFMVDSLGTTVTVYENNVLKSSFVVGKMGTTYNEIYARKTNSNDVVLIEGAMNYMFNKPVKDWRDKQIVSVQKEKINQVKFQYGDTAFTLTSSGPANNNVWMIGKDSTQSPAVNSLLSSLSSVQADDFVDGPLPQTPKLTAQISYGETELRFALSKDSGKYLVQSSNSPQWFIIEQWRANELLKRKKDLVKQKTK